MSWANVPGRFGRTSRLLHWGMALLILTNLGLGTWLSQTQPSLANLWLYGLHKTIGVSVLALAAVRLVWHRLNPPPPPFGNTGWQLLLARVVHITLYLLMLAVPISGWVASSASGIDTVIFNRWTLPAIAPPSEQLSDTGFVVHAILTNILMALLLLHVIGALRHGGGALGRMIRD